MSCDYAQGNNILKVLTFKTEKMPATSTTTAVFSCLLQNPKLLPAMFTVFYETPYCGDAELEFNASSVDEDFEKSMAQLRHIAYQIIGPTLITAGIVGNILNLIVLARPFLNDCTRIYLRALAIADIHVLLFDITMLVRLNRLESGNLWVAIYYAHFELTLVTTFIAFNVYIVICLTIDRYVSVCWPMMFNTMHTPRNAKIAISLCFALAVVVSLPLCIMKRICRTNTTCRNWSFQDHTEITYTTYWFIYLVISETAFRIGPALLLAVLNILIIREFGVLKKKRNKIRKPVHQPSNALSCAPRSKKYQDEKRLVVFLQAVVVLFFTTTIPSACLSFLYSEYRDKCMNFEIFRATANLLEIANSALNFCAYFLCSKDFRRGLLNIFICRGVDREPQRIPNGGCAKATSVIKTICNETINNAPKNDNTEIPVM